MTRESPRDSGSSSEERSDSRDSEPLRGSENPSGERSDPREDEPPRDSPESSGERSDAVDPDDFYTDGGEDVPLNIAGHEDRDPPGAGDIPGAGTATPDEADGATPDDEEDDEEVEPVELLVQLAEDGEIDPWDIDVVAVTDKFLDAIEEADLRTSGRALFYASVLIRMKSDELLAPDQDEEEEEVPPWEAAFADDRREGEAPEGDGPPPGIDPVDGLEAEMERRLDRKHARGTPETLDELVRELREAERSSWWKESRSYDTSDSPSGFSRGTQELDYHSGDDLRVDDEPTEDDVTGTTHQEDIETVIEDVESALREQYDAGRAEVLFAEIEESGGARVRTYLALLFLAHRGQVRLEQDELFGDLWVQDPAAATGSEEAVAD